ncbi:hypothetical protein [Pseudofrankia inefficax]|uniref:Integral membrane protein n=1 Tax=Pseudofrankia inefficax (strain DSM 45817 / CECT 9037 / DDB 130130 / EuI1c) TaxID=298654 RepID=E3J4Y9_PSEI1|nr:hypothetical protein [Pseudofrankia inefficax]ADP79440.1 hypothetical protein FraEuI1c_1373 [Pseudofrankia inefficax]
MHFDSPTQRAGAIGTAGGILWLVNWVLLVPDPADESAGWYASGVVAFLALLATAALIGGVRLVDAGGPGRFARITLAAWTVGWLVLSAGSLVELVTGNGDNPLYPVGGILTSLAGLVSGILVVRSRVLGSWRRYAVLALGIGYVLLGPLQSGDDRTALSSAAELVEYLLILVTAIAVATAAPSPRVVPAIP